MASHLEESEPRYYGMHIGVVAANDDPEVLGRVKVRVPGVIDGESPWAWPIGMPGAGSAQRGLFDVPPQGSEVAVWFLQGDPERPYWMPGYWGKPGGTSEAPTALKGAEPAEQGAIKAYETARWLVTYDERQQKERFRIEDKVSGDHIEFDGNKMALEIAATTTIRLVGKGQVLIEGLDISIGGRKLLQNGKPIE